MCFLLNLLSICFVFSFPGCFAFWCFPCFACMTTKRYGQCLCLPLLDSFGFIPPISLSMRVSMRQRYGIKVSTKLYSPWHKVVVIFSLTVVMETLSHYYYFLADVLVLPLQGDICNDCLCATFCTPCSWCQMSREMKRRNIQVLLVSAKNTWPSQLKLHLLVVVTYDSPMTPRKVKPTLFIWWVVFIITSTDCHLVSYISFCLKA